ncbi:serine hydrolase domain-containing protein [Microtetraspora niveoalba]|uniref:serine hydrolase domain-containing protein n=1 Tax=Microtetraspora niveoalba TaxID=46175 RepID=UPI00082DCDAC|nr:serine hydrolase domain-containing protein [Microtetraspora niveoalba]
MADLQRDVQDAIDELVASGAERGVQVAVCRRGVLVVDAVAGVADPEAARVFTSDTPVYATSTGKGVTAAVVHVLAERGALDYDTPIADVWPEFAARGKGKATVRHALTHATGVPGLPVGTTPEDLCDWDATCAVIANAVPWWEPGTRSGYHPQTYGYILGEVVRRVTGKAISQVLREEVAGPLGVADELFFGVPASELHRLARIEDAPFPMMEPSAETPEGAQEEGVTEMAAEMMAEIPFFRVVDGYTAAPMAALPDAAFSNRSDVLTSDIPAGATMTARAVARLYDALLNGTLVSPARLAELSSAAVTGVDEVTGAPATWGLGYTIGLTEALADPSLFGMAGSGGTAAFADTATGLSVGVMKNRASAGDFTTVERIARIVLQAG